MTASVKPLPKARENDIDRTHRLLGWCGTALAVLGAAALVSAMVFA